MDSASANAGFGIEVGSLAAESGGHGCEGPGAMQTTALVVCAMLTILKSLQQSLVVVLPLGSEMLCQTPASTVLEWK